MHNWSWSDLRFVLAVAREGSAAAAARALGVNHSTVVRRVRAFEASLDARIFDHLSTGYRLTETGEIFLDAARSIDGVVQELGRKVVGGERELAGNVRITTTDAIVTLMLDDLAELRRLHPRVTLDVRITNLQLNLDLLDAEIAVRPTRDPPPQLIGRHICDLAFGLYAAGTLLDAAGEAGSGTIASLGLGGPLATSSIGRWLDETTLSGPVVARCDSFNSLLALAERGVGCAVLPCWLGDGSATLRRVVPEPLEFRNQLWLLHHRDVLRSRRVRTVADFLVESLRAKRGLLEGTDRRAGGDESRR